MNSVTHHEAVFHHLFISFFVQRQIVENIDTRSNIPNSINVLATTTINCGVFPAIEMIFK